MRTKTMAGLLPALSVLFAAGCSISQNVRPVNAPDIATICIKHNAETFMSDFEGELKAQVDAKGIKARVYVGDVPAECRYRLEYTANWHWDLAMYLVYADLRVYDRDLLIGEANYDSRGGGFNLGKFGHTSEKLKPLVEQLFKRS